MVKSQEDKSTKVADSSLEPPKIPPRMKKKGPALPEKPPHMRVQSSSLSPSSHQPAREPLKPRHLSSNIDPHQTQREVLVAASKAIREKPVERRQREPAKLLMPTFGDPSPPRISREVVPGRKGASFLDDQILVAGGRRDFALLPARTVDDQVLVGRKDFVLVPSSRLDGFPPRKGDTTRNRKARQHQPLLLIPRAPVSWGAPPVSFALWPQRDPVNKGGRREPARSAAPLERQRSGSVTRSGSLTSQGSSGSDSGNETFPKSVLKKQKRTLPSTTSRAGGSSTSKKLEHKKNVTFNAFATVQLMEE